MKKNILSIIMPVYNSEKYLKKSLDSIIENLDENMELIIIDDYSSDNSVEIINQYLEKYKEKNITLIKNDKNKGAGLSKNLALDLVNSEYVGFIDSDDYVDEKYFQNMLELAIKENSDIVVSDIALTYEKEIIKNDIYTNNLYSKKADTAISKELVLGNWACASTCNKIFKSALIKNIRFSDKSSDDIIFTIKALINANKLSYCKNNYYYYYQSQNSLTRNKKYKKYEESVKCLFEAIDMLYKYNITWAQIYAANSLISFICYSLNDLAISDISSFLKIIKDNFKDEEKRNKIIENAYLKNTALYRSKTYRNVIKLIKNNQYDKILNLIEEQEKDINKYRKKTEKIENDFNPLVSIIIPVYNGENYIEEAINSALNQTYKNIEILVIDDGSKDNTEKICEKYKNKIQYIKKENGGVATALNEGIKNMKGEYFSWLSHDDLYFENKIEAQISFLSKSPEKNVILFSNYILINENGRKLETIILDHKMIVKKPEYILLRGCIGGITMLIPKEVFKTYEFGKKLRCTQDYDLWHKLLKKYKFIHMEDILAKTRVHSLQDTNINPNVVTEGEELWTYMIEDVPDNRKIALEGSIYNYYYQMANHLKQSPYTKTFNMCIDKCKKINEKKYNKSPIVDFKELSNIKKVKYCLKNYGIIYTISIIIKKLKK